MVVLIVAVRTPLEEKLINEEKLMNSGVQDDLAVTISGGQVSVPVSTGPLSLHTLGLLTLIG